MTQSEIHGWGSLSRIPEIVDRVGARHIFLITGRGSFAASGAEEALAKHLSRHSVVRFCDFHVNCRIEDISKGVDLLADGAFDLIIAVGGGSVMDMAKLVNIFKANGGEMMSYVTGRTPIEKRGLPLAAVPTTSGSGSEATHFAVLYVDKVKYSVAHEYMRPDYCLIDPALTSSLPPQITASSGVDALGQAIESYWSVNSTDTSKSYSEQAIEQAVAHLKQAVKAPDKASRQAMADAAHLAGKAIDIAKTTGPHALSYYFTSHYDVPHGHAVALTLGRFIQFNSRVSRQDVADARGVDYVRCTMERLLGLLGVKSPEEGTAMIEDLMTEIGLETDVRKVGLGDAADVAELIRGINADRLKNNPRKVRPADIPLVLGIS
jgi:alcohol dehydrogenase class IV